MDAKVVVFGSVNSDLLVCAQRLPFHGETIRGDSIEYQLGGKGANQAVASARGGAPTILLGAVGEDDQGAVTVSQLEKYGVCVEAVKRVPGSTGFAVVMTSPQDNQIVIIPGANEAVDEALADSAPISAADICLAQLETPTAGIKRFFERACAAGAKTLLNAAPSNDAARELIPLLDILIVNESECRDLAIMPGADLSSDAVLVEAAGNMGLQPEQVMILTLGAIGVAIVSDGAVRRIAGQKVPVVDTTGAGDCFCGYLAAGLAQGLPLDLATERANIAASLAVQSRGAASSMPTDGAVAEIWRTGAN